MIWLRISLPSASGFRVFLGATGPLTRPLEVEEYCNAKALSSNARNRVFDKDQMYDPAHQI